MPTRLPAPPCWLPKTGAALVAAAWLTTGCSLLREPTPAREDRDPSRLLREAREAEMNRQWENRTYAELLLGKGTPRILLDIPGGGSPPGFVVVYPRDPVSGCLDVFAMMYGRQILVRAYQCR
jgi:hypothetical protein